MEWLSDPHAWIGLLTLTLLEIVLGIDNVIFISILADKLPAAKQKQARQIGLALAWSCASCSCSRFPGSSG
jgi:predicted tellurium resistance membrane protein TerC